MLIVDVNSENLLKEIENNLSPLDYWYAELALLKLQLFVQV